MAQGGIQVPMDVGDIPEGNAAIMKFFWGSAVEGTKLDCPRSGSPSVSPAGGVKVLLILDGVRRGGGRREVG